MSKEDIVHNIIRKLLNLVYVKTCFLRSLRAARGVGGDCGGAGGGDGGGDGAGGGGGAAPYPGPPPHRPSSTFSPRRAAAVRVGGSLSNGDLDLKYHGNAKRCERGSINR